MQRSDPGHRAPMFGCRSQGRARMSRRLPHTTIRCRRCPSFERTGVPNGEPLRSLARTPPANPLRSPRGGGGGADHRPHRRGVLPPDGPPGCEGVRVRECTDLPRLRNHAHRSPVGTEAGKTHAESPVFHHLTGIHRIARSLRQLRRPRSTCWLSRSHGTPAGADMTASPARAPLEWLAVRDRCLTDDAAGASSLSRSRPAIHREPVAHRGRGGRSAPRGAVCLLTPPSPACPGRPPRRRPSQDQAARPRPSPPAGSGSGSRPAL